MTTKKSSSTTTKKSTKPTNTKMKVVKDEAIEATIVEQSEPSELFFVSHLYTQITIKTNGEEQVVSLSGVEGVFPVFKDSESANKFMTDLNIPLDRLFKLSFNPNKDENKPE